MSRAGPRSPEVGLSLAAATGAVLAAPVALAVGTVAGGLEAGVAAAVGAFLPGGLALIVLPLMMMADRVPASATVGLALAALGLRLGWALAIFAVLARTGALPLRPLALGLVLGLVAAIGAEMTAWAREPRWSLPDSRPPGARSTTTRSTTPSGADAGDGTETRD